MADTNTLKFGDHDYPVMSGSVGPQVVARTIVNGTPP